MTTESDDLARRIARMEAVHEVQNVMGRYSFLHSANMHRETMELFALELPDVRAEMMWGVYEGAESIERLYPGYHAWVDGDARGKMHMHTLTTPIIEVDRDATTAQGVWISPGHETMAFVTESNEAMWAWCKYGADFIRIDGVWKIWHLHVYGLFMSPYNTSWVDAAEPEGGPPLDDRFEPDRPATTHWMYSPDVVYANEPAPPRPYDVFDDDRAF